MSRALPKEKAKDIFTDGCLILEGGALRGLYTAGVIDALMLNDINIKTVIGVSAGALNGINYISGDIGRSAFINLNYRNDERYLGKKALIRNKGIIGYDFLFSQEIMAEYPLNLKRFGSKENDLIAVATNCLSGEATYFHKNDPNFFKALKASSALPFVSHSVEIEGVPYLDGGIAVKIPLAYALENNYDKIVVVNTRDRSYRRKKNELRRASKAVYRKYPKFIEAYEKTNTNYNQTCDLLDKLEKEDKIFRIAPRQKVTVKRLENDIEKLNDLYWLGYDDTFELVSALKNYLTLNK